MPTDPMEAFMEKHWPASNATVQAGRTTTAVVQTSQTPVTSQVVSTDIPEEVQPTQPKNKTVAIVLAVFLGFFTWIYTYKRDAWKFWLNLALTIVTFGLWNPIAWIWAMVDAFLKPEDFYKEFPNK